MTEGLGPVTDDLLCVASPEQMRAALTAGLLAALGYEPAGLVGMVDDMLPVVVAALAGDRPAEPASSEEDFTRDPCNYCGTRVGVGSDYMCCDCALAWRAGFDHPSNRELREHAKAAAGGETEQAEPRWTKEQLHDAARFLDGDVHGSPFWTGDPRESQRVDSPEDQQEGR